MVVAVKPIGTTKFKDKSNKIKKIVRGDIREIKERERDKRERQTDPQ